MTETSQDPIAYGDALEEVVECAQRLSRAWEAEPHAHADAEIEYSSELVALASRTLYFATEALPRDKRPVGWNTRPANQILPVMFSRADLDMLIGKLDVTPDEYFDLPQEHRDLLNRLRQERWAFDRHPEES